ncbi:hypothetical protein MCC01972_14450 [Bifidobacteriaceae bacterium MCC01972]|nr:hypothetical protein MCC01972_14450 [Bifidobacteriaceae bacterium MCC01972]GDY99407.1 hypothetical protein MCC01975_07390 [Bifidobacteriaceae bacterium MCC01975]
MLAFEYPALANASAMATATLLGAIDVVPVVESSSDEVPQSYSAADNDFPTLLVRAATLPETALTTFMTIRPFNPTSNAAPAAMSFVLVFKG